MLFPLKLSLKRDRFSRTLLLLIFKFEVSF